MAVDLIVWGIYLVSLYYGVFWFLVYLEHGAKDEKVTSTIQPFVSVCIPAYNEESTIINTIKSVIALDYPKNKLEILVINDGSKDNTAKIVENFIKQSNYNIKLITQFNSGKGAAMNNAIKHAKGEIFVNLDADSYVRSDALKEIIPYFENKEIASVLPVIKTRQKNTFMRKLQHVEYLVNFFYKKLIAKLDCIHVTPGPFAAYRKEVIQKIGGFDEDNLTEDLEIAMRLQRHNYKIVQILGTEVTTDAPKNFKAFYKQRNRWYKGSLINLWAYKDLLFNKKYGEFGMFYLPTVFSIALIAIFYATYLSYSYMLKPVLNYLYDMSFINFNVPFMVSEASKNFSLLDLNYMTMFYGFSLILLGLVVLRFAFRFTNERLSKALFPASMYMIIYPSLLAITWLGVVFDLARGKKQKW